MRRVLSISDVLGGKEITTARAASWVWGACAALAVLLVGASVSAAPSPPPADLAVFRPMKAAEAADSATPDWGVSADAALTTPARGFVPTNNSTTFDESSDGMRYSTGTTGLFGMSINLPTGAAITALELVACNEDPSGYLSLALRDCPDTGACTGSSAWTGYGSPGTCGAWSYTLSSAVTVMNGSHSYDFTVWPSIASNLTRFRAGRIFYHLQVSPAPGTATFTDVPTNYWAFQYIEALAAAGITSGCGGGNFCPTTPVTRDQMAVFLAKALGLHWAP